MNGAELLVKYSPISKLTMQAALGYVHAKQVDTGKLPYIASWTGSLNLDYSYYPQHHLILGLIYNGDREDSNTYAEDDSEAFTLVNLNLHGHINKQINYALGIDNLFDKKVYDPAADFGSRYNNERTEREIWAKITFKMQ